MTIPFRAKLLTETAKAPTRENAGDLWDLYADDFYNVKIENTELSLYIVVDNTGSWSVYLRLKNDIEKVYFNCLNKYSDELLEEFINDYERLYEKNFLKKIKQIYYISDSITDHKKETLLNFVPRGIQAHYKDCDYKHELTNNNLTRNYNSFCHLAPKGRILVKTGISLELPKKYVGYSNDINSQWLYDESSCELHEDNWELEAYAVADIRPRSGLALKHGITVLNTPGTIDNSYRKEIGVILYNAGHEPYTITKGDKIAQMLIRPLYPSKMEIVKDIEDTGRGGYGSTGK